MTLWTEEEEKYLREALRAGKKPADVKLAGRTQSAISVKMSRMRYQKQKRWTDRERKILKEFYNNIPMEELLEKLPGRTAGSVRGQVSRLKAKKLIRK